MGGHLERRVDRITAMAGSSERGCRFFLLALSALGGIVPDPVIRSEPQRELVCDAFGQLPGVDEDEGGAMGEHVLGDPVEHVGELGPARHRLELRPRQLDGHIEVAAVSAVDDGGRRPGRVGTGEQTGDRVEWALGRREADALELPTCGRDDVVETLEGEGEMGPALVTGQGVDLVDDDSVDPGQHGSGGSGREEQVQRLRRGHEEIRGVLHHGGAIGRRRVPGPRRDPHFWPGEAQPVRLGGDAGQGHLQVGVHIGGQRPQRRDVDHTGSVAGPVVGQPGGMFPVGGIDRHEKAGQGLAGAGG